ncbi:hypothetical protein P7K49_034642 [Saguinus oedipus]|uniref:Uncharacterized protein n=1 Tax=Saguinus oedipus TaxID=9490 RepID=A0ABQ9TW65_SAGOE|nr:hypothetical protein P7K49_034642 [Saguinus oedipus]
METGVLETTKVGDVGSSRASPPLVLDYSFLAGVPAVVASLLAQRPGVGPIRGAVVYWGAPTPTPALTEYSSDHQAADMAEIDARLKALQEYMNRLDMRS